jgi:hypothetical protein
VAPAADLRRVYGYSVLFCLSPAGVAQALPEKLVENAILEPCKVNKKRRELGRAATAREYFGFPSAFEHHYRASESSTPKDVWAGEMLHFALNYYVATAVGMQVRATRNGDAVAFNLGLNDTSKFFSDRATGKERKIFHYVGAHRRLLQHGASVPVSAHYRGLRAFEWRGERIYISPPEQSDTTFDMTAVEVADDAPEDPTMAGSAVVGDLVKQSTQRAFKVVKGDFVQAPL